MTPPTSINQYGSLVSGAPALLTTGIRAITRNAPANSTSALMRCCRP